MVLVYHWRNVIKGKELYYNWRAKESAVGSSGTITITKNSDTYIEGTFSFNGVGATKVTEGKFRVFKKY